MTPLTVAVFWRGVCDGGDGIWADGFPLSLARASRTPTQWAFSVMLRTIYTQCISQNSKKDDMGDQGMAKLTFSATVKVTYNPDSN